MNVLDPNVLHDRLGRLPLGATLLERLAPGAPVYVVGGAVRDLMLGHDPRDLDVVVEGELEPVATQIGEMTRLHPRFGTCTVTVDGRTYDFARARTETYSRPGVLPAVAPAGIDEDLARRDFSVNAFALGVAGPRRGELLSVPGAAEDLAAGHLRVLHDASFRDDATRLLRMVRYATRLGFAAEPHTHDLAAAAVDDGLLDTVGGARSGAELRLLAAEPDPVAALRGLNAYHLGEALHAGFGLRDDADGELAERALALLPADGDRAALVIAVAARRLTASQLDEMLQTLTFRSDRGEVISEAVLQSAPLAAALRDADRASQIARAAATETVETVALAGALDPAAADRAERWLQSLREVRLQIGGHDLIEAGVPDGPPIGAGLAGALAAKLDGEADDRKAELAAALRAAENAG